MRWRQLAKGFIKKFFDERFEGIFEFLTIATIAIASFGKQKSTLRDVLFEQSFLGIGELQSAAATKKKYRAFEQIYQLGFG